MLTYLKDTENNICVIEDDSGKMLKSDIIRSIEYRIAKHLEHNKRDEHGVLGNVSFGNAITSAKERIKERQAKIGELKEFIKYCL